MNGRRWLNDNKTPGPMSAVTRSSWRADRLQAQKYKCIAVLLMETLAISRLLLQQIQRRSAHADSTNPLRPCRSHVAWRGVHFRPPKPLIVQPTEDANHCATRLPLYIPVEPNLTRQNLTKILTASMKIP